MNQVEFKVKLKQTKTEKEIIIEEYIEYNKVSQASIISDYDNYDHNRENIAKIVFLLGELMQKNQSYQEQIIFLQSTIDEAIKTSKTNICKKQLQQIKSDYNDYLLGHRRQRDED